MCVETRFTVLPPRSVRAARGSNRFAFGSGPSPAGCPLPAGHVLGALGRERTQAARGRLELRAETVTCGARDDAGEFGERSREEVLEGGHVLGGELLRAKTMGSAEGREETRRPVAE